MSTTLDNTIAAHNRFARAYKEVAFQISDERADLRTTMLAIGATFATLRFALEETVIYRGRYADALYQLGRLYAGLRFISKECQKADTTREIVRSDTFQYLFTDIEEMKAGWTRLLVGRDR